MKTSQRKIVRKLWFKRWSRKANAAFLSLGKVVHIGTLAAQICDKALEKTVQKGSRIRSLLNHCFTLTLTEAEETDISPHSVLLLQNELILTILNIKSKTEFPFYHVESNHYKQLNPVNRRYKNFVYRIFYFQKIIKTNDIE